MVKLNFAVAALALATATSANSIEAETDSAIHEFQLRSRAFNGHQEWGGLRVHLLESGGKTYFILKKKGGFTFGYDTKHKSITTFTLSENKPQSIFLETPVLPHKPRYHNVYYKKGYDTTGFVQPKNGRQLEFHNKAVDRLIFAICNSTIGDYTGPTIMTRKDVAMSDLDCTDAGLYPINGV